MRNAILFRATLVAAPMVSSWIAFSQSAQAHALDVLIGQGACGNLVMTPDAPVIFGHCVACWSAGATAGVAALFVMLAMGGLHRRMGVAVGLRRIP